MFIVAVTLYVKPDCIGKVIEAALANARNTRKEPGNLRFDVSQAVGNPGQLLLYEVYRTEADFHTHHQTPHYLHWKQIVADWMTQPRQAVQYNSAFFGDSEG